jgi:hypothetical protein
MQQKKIGCVTGAKVVLRFKQITTAFHAEYYLGIPFSFCAFPNLIYLRARSSMFMLLTHPVE